MGCVVIQILWLTQGGNCMANKEYKSDVFSMFFRTRNVQWKFITRLMERTMTIQNWLK